jgi:hypothetical protein
MPVQIIELEEVSLVETSDDVLEMSMGNSAQCVTAPTSGCCCWD